jgi:tetratricopeptide (TPR) repeat protein
MAGDVASLAAQISPYISAAVGAYGGAVLAKVRDDAASATVGLGRRLLQRIFGSHSTEDALPGPLQDLVNDPNDIDALAALRFAIKKKFDADTALVNDIRSILIAEEILLQDVDAGRDANTAGRDQTVIARVSGDVYVGAGQMPNQSDIVPRYQLLTDAQYFTGRDAELDQLRKAIASRKGVPSGAVAIHAIDGGAGVGKTALVVHLAHELAPHYKDGQLYLDLQAYTANASALDPSLALSRLLGALNVQGSQIPKSLDERAALWRELLRARQVLVVLDNALNYDQIKPLLPGASESLMLITSRNRMIARGKLPSLPLGAFTPREAIELFAKIVDPDRLTSQDEAVARVVENCGYLPLTVELAANQLVMHPSWTVSDLADNLAESFRADNNDVVEAVLELTYRYLDSDLKRVFRFLGLHPGSIIAPEDVAALTHCASSDAGRILEDLYRIHLIEDSPYGAHRYRVHDLVRDYALRLVSREDSEADRSASLHRLLDSYLYYAAIVDRWLRCLNHRSVDVEYQPSEEFQVKSFGEALTWMEERYQNVISCARRAQDLGVCPHAWRIPEMLAYFMRIRGHLPEATDIHSAGLKVAYRCEDLLGQATALYNLGIVDRLTGNAAGSREQLGRALEIYRVANDVLGQAETLRALGILERLSGDYAKAKEQLDQALVLHLSLNNRLGEAWVLGAQGILSRLTGWFISARDCFSDALEIIRVQDDKLGEAWMLNELGSLDRLTGFYHDARQRLLEAIDLFHELGDKFSLAWAMCQLGVIDRLTGAYLNARRRFEESLNIVRDLGNQFAEARILCELSVLDRLGGDYLTARSRLSQALENYRTIADSLGQAWALCELAILDGMTGDYASPTSRLSGEIAIYRDLGERLGEAWTLNALGVVDRLTGNFPNKRSPMDHMLTAYRNLGNPLGEAWTLSTLGVLGRLTGKYESARSNLQQALKVHDRLKNRPGEAWTLGTLGVVEILTGNYSSACNHLEAATTMYHHLGNRLGEAWTLRELAVLDKEMAKFNDAKNRLDEVHRIYVDLGDGLGVAATLVEVGELQAGSEDADEAEALWGQAIEIFEELGLTVDASYVRSRLR